MDKSSDELIRAYQDANTRYHLAQNDRWYHVIRLSHIVDSRIPKIFIEALSDDDSILRHYACVGLVARSTQIPLEKWRDERQIYLAILKELVEAANEKALQASGHVCMTCAALARVGGISVITTLIQALGSENRDIRESARVGLALLLQDGEPILGHLLQALKLETVLIRVGVAWVLYRFDAKFETTITKCLQDVLDLPNLTDSFSSWLDRINGIPPPPQGIE